MKIYFCILKLYIFILVVLNIRHFLYHVLHNFVSKISNILTVIWLMRCECYFLSKFILVNIK